MFDKLARKLEHEHVKLYSTQEYKILFSNAGLNYVEHLVIARWIVFPVKVHVGEKPSG
jgi:hypothetical protein